ncbi:MAG TPA: geranylgeranyl reductase family protein [Desulfomonilaceae bacterium]|nr:geranylgeranyl reductase family protein [Desulfomonilaceae bacterium]
MLPSECDILVVGAGPAGSCAALSAAREGVRTVLIDAKTRIGEQPHCGEFVPEQLRSEFHLTALPILQAVRIMETRIRVADESGVPCFTSVHSTKKFVRTAETMSGGFLIDRCRFDRNLAREAAAAGTTVVSGARLMHRCGSTWVVRYRGHDYSISSKFTIAADGATSRVAALVGLPRSSVIRGVQVEAPLHSALDRTVVFLDREYVGGYGWLFPKGTVANVGLGVIPGTDIHPSQILDRFLHELSAEGMIRPGILARSGGLIAVSGLRNRLVHGNVILAGDAAGLTHPISGAGIPQALFSGTLAGAAAASAVKSGHAESLEAYEAEIAGRYQGILSHALSKRLTMMGRWNDPDFQKTCEDTWIGFKGYRKRVRVSGPNGGRV